MGSTAAISKTLKRPLISPLRYPGGKSLLYTKLRAIIRANELSAGTYVEPYAGGAGAAMGLLVTGEVQRVVLNDLDPNIHAFWKAVVDEPDRFSHKIKTAKLSVTEWTKQKRVYASGDSADQFERGFATFYLNRTNRSGVLNGGPIGGLDQTGNYKIDARFNKDQLQERIRLISLYSSKIEITSKDGKEVIKRHAKRKNTIIYADPPYFEKAGSLYLNTFTDGDHEALALLLNGSSHAKWLLTYDNVSRVSELYSDRRREEFDLNYSAHTARVGKEIMVFSDELTIPEW
ncbi:MAG: DNA adenine methylase [Solirubrobacterales bacterium]|nr:DNA adenine methylase [Solirubrobacterales bacterium]